MDALRPCSCHIWQPLMAQFRMPDSSACSFSISCGSNCSLVKEALKGNSIIRRHIPGLVSRISGLWLPTMTSEK
ncbi:hypothetical protein D3C86_1876390 [compost metagenome]